MNSTPPGSWYDDLLVTVIAAIAGVLGHHMRNLTDRRSTTIKRCIFEAAASGFVGYLTVLLCRTMNLSYEWTGFIAGVLGWLGATASIQLFARAMRSKLGITDENTIDPAERRQNPVDTLGSNPPATPGDN